MNEVMIWCWTLENGAYLPCGSCFEECLLLTLEETKKYYTEDKKYKALLDTLKKNKGNKHPQDKLYDIFWEKVFLDFEFAKHLRLFDIVNPFCFNSNYYDGECIISLMNSADINFILVKKEWQTKYKLTLHFQTMKDDYVINLFDDMRCGKIQLFN